MKITNTNMIRNRLYHNPKIEIGRSPVHGWGVFAKETISANEILEEVPYLRVPMERGESSPLFIDYRFNYPANDNWHSQVLPYGSACLYNHSNDPSAYWITDEENETFIFKSNRDIKAGEEIFTYYGDVGYWSDGRGYIDVK